jgi:hypothetical protein
MTTRNRPTLPAYAGSAAFAIAGERDATGTPAGWPGEGVWSAVTTRRTDLAALTT